MDRPKILLVDDRKENLVALEAILEDISADIFLASSGNEALGLMLEHEFALVLLDVQMPDMDGFETAAIIRSREKNMYTPLIFVTAISKEQQHIFAGYEKGAVDYLFKPLDDVIINSKVQVFLDLYRQRRALEQANNDLRITLEELHESNRKILEDQRHLIEEERLRILLQLAGATAQEMSNPVNAILEGLDILKLQSQQSKEMRESMERIWEAGQMLRGITNNVKEFPLIELTQLHSEAATNNSNRKINILCVDDSKNYLELLSHMLKPYSHISLIYAENCADTETMLSNGKNSFDLILLDHNLPDGTSSRILSFVRQNKIEIPVIIITGEGDEVVAARALKLGAVDYLTKNAMTKNNLLESIDRTIEQHRLKQEFKSTMTKVVNMATRDNLTGLYNRRYFLEALESEMEREQRYKQGFSIGIIDVDNFKFINDTYGHIAGDTVLKGVGKMMMDAMRTSDLACRYGGDEFTIILPHTSEENAYTICERFVRKVESQVFMHDGHHLHVTLSIGIASLNGEEDGSITHLIEKADKELYLAKENGRNQVSAVFKR